MATGSITSLGIGSGLDLQDILDQLKGVDQTRITVKENEKTELQSKVDAYNTVNAKLFGIKSDALNLSLSSNFLSNSVSLTDENIISATSIGDGYEEASYDIEVTQKAQRNSWTSTAVESETDIMFAAPSSGIDDSDTTAVTSQAETLSIYYGTYGEVSTDNSIAAGTTDSDFAINGVTIGTVTVLEDDSDDALVDAINALTDDHGVTASVDDDGILTLTPSDQSDITITPGAVGDGDTDAVLGGGTFSDTGQQQIDISLTSGMTFEEIIDEINDSTNNTDDDGVQLVTASYGLDENDEYYVRLSATSGGNSIDSEITVSGFDWVAADTMVNIAQDSSNMYLSVPPGTTYTGLASLINDSDDNPGVTAAIIDNGDTTNPYQLSLTSDDTGEDAILTLTNLDDLTEVTGTGDLNAKFSVNGIAYQRQSNTAINDAITGVTFDIKNITAADESTTLNLEVNLGSVKEDIISMVEGFNDLIAYIKGTDTATDETETDTDDDETSNPLEASSSANRIVYNLQSLLTTILDIDSDYTSLTDLGLSFSSGVISINETTLDEAISTDPDALQTLFIGDSDEEITGLADIINDALTDMVSSAGIASTEISQAETQITRIDEDIESQSARLTKKYETMAGEFARLDSYISQLNSESSALTSMINAFNDASKDK